MRSLMLIVLAVLSFAPLTAAHAQSAADKILAQRFAGQLALAEEGNLEAQLNVATAYEHGVGVEKSLVEAIRWYEAAAEQASPEAMYELGSMIHDSHAWDDTSLEAREAVDQSLVWYHRAAQAGNAGAQNSLGLIYGFGDRVEIDRVRGRMWLFVAEASGHVMQGSLVGRMEKNMSAKEVAAAKSRADACIAADHAGCD